MFGTGWREENAMGARQRRRTIAPEGEDQENAGLRRAADLLALADQLEQLAAQIEAAEVPPVDNITRVSIRERDESEHDLQFWDNLLGDSPERPVHQEAAMEESNSVINLIPFPDIEEDRSNAGNRESQNSRGIELIPIQGQLQREEDEEDIEAQPGNSGIGDQVFAIDRQVTTCEKEDGFVEWFDRPIPAELNPTPYVSVNIGAPLPRQGSSTKTPVMYTENPPGGRITMETGAWENSPAQFHLQRNNKFVNEMHWTDYSVKPKDRLWFYWPPLSENLPHGGNPDFRMLLAYHGTEGLDLRLGYSLTRTPTARITLQHPQIRLFASDGTIWDGVEPLPDEKRPEHIEKTLAAQAAAYNEPQEAQIANERELTPDEIGAQKGKLGRFGRFLGKIGKVGNIFKGKGSKSNADQPVPGLEANINRDREENKEEEKVDISDEDAEKRAPRWYREMVEEWEEGGSKEEEFQSPRYSEFGMGGQSVAEVEEVQISNQAGNPRPNVYSPFYSRPGWRVGGPQDANNPNGRIGDSDENDPS
ncbi:hypothetical protein TWF970_006501 [Orbilia oligospora]|uniref:Uncharacterized protein n=1 Tax=Orbilia oligospora TaxID=2813651 RepID=A0A7C8V428_ORBOL|nr:hypothetical protein TWF970_006501 [Orbilia oligospora]